MSDNDNPTSKGGWTDRQRLAYLLNWIEVSKLKFDHYNAPRPEGKTAMACKSMIQRLKASLKDDMDAMNNGTAMSEDKPKKRKAADDGEGAPAKKGRKKKPVKSEPEVENGGEEA